MNKFFIWLIKLYQKISKGGPRVCRFEPTCSFYAIEALQKHSFWRAFLLIAGRLLRCHPLNPGGYDPVK